MMSAPIYPPVFENLIEDSEGFQETLTEVTFEYLLKEPDVPDHVKGHVKKIQELYRVMALIKKDRE